MTLCRKCGKEIPDGEELCQDCMTKESSSGEGYLDELIQSIEIEEPQFKSATSDNSAADELALDDLFANDISISELEDVEEIEDIEENAEGEGESLEEIPVLDEVVEESENATGVDDDINALLSILEKDYDDYIMDEEDSGEPEDVVTEVPTVAKEAELSFFSEEESDNIFADAATGTSVDDIFSDALSAVEYSENEDSDLDGVMALDDSMGFEESQVLEAEDDLLDSMFSEEQKPEMTAESKDKTDSFLNRVFGNIITEQTAEEEEKEREREEEEARAKAASKEEKKQQAAALKEEKALKAQEEKEKKAVLKAEMAATKAAQKEEKKRMRAELEASEIVGKINPVGAAIVMIFFAVVGISVIFGSHLFSYSSAVRGAEKKFEERDYAAAYQSIAGVEVSESKKEMEDKIRICMKMQRELDAYSNYYEMKMYLEALDSLMKGIRYYDANKKIAEQYEIISQYNELESKIASALYSEFGVSETQARYILTSETQEEYTAKLEEIIQLWESKMKEDER